MTDLKAQEACIELLELVLADAREGKVTTVGIVACGPGDFGANIAGPDAPNMNLGLDVLKAKIIANVTAAPKHAIFNQTKPAILRPRPVTRR